jgi:predicted RNA methylase
MGIVRMGIPEKLTLFLKEIFHSDFFIETGTYYGSTTVWAAAYFDEVHTIEFSRKLFDETSRKLSDIKNIDFHFGDTRVILSEILDSANSREKIILWLDGVLALLMAKMTNVH